MDGNGETSVEKKRHTAAFYVDHFMFPAKNMLDLACLGTLIGFCMSGQTLERLQSLAHKQAQKIVETTLCIKDLKDEWVVAQDLMMGLAEMR